MAERPAAEVATVPAPAGGITGMISTSDGQPAAFVTVTIKENGLSAMTDEGGYFGIKGLKEGIYTLEITMVGLQPQQKTVEVKKDRLREIRIVMSENARQLSEVTIRSGRRLNSRPAAIGKMEIHPMDLPQGITVVGQGSLREQQVQRLGDVIKSVNGVYVTSTRGSVQESFGARGYTFGSTNLFKNGARINAGAMPEMSSLEKVEVLKGSAAILYGQVAPGGIVNLVTRQPRFNSGGELGLRLGSYGLIKPSFDVYGPLSSSLAYRVNGAYEKASSFREGVESERYYVNPSLLLKAGDKTDVLLEGDYLYHSFTPDFGIPSVDNTQIPVLPRSAFFGAPWQYSHTRQATATATIKHRFNDVWKLNASVAYQRYQRDYFSLERLQAAANGDLNRAMGRLLINENYYTGQVNLLGKFATGAAEHNLLAGVDADHTGTGNRDFSFGASNIYDKINIFDEDKYERRTDIPTVMPIRERMARVNRIGVYVQDLVKVSPRFNVLVGGRWSYLENRGIDSTAIATGEKSSGSSSYDNAFSPRVGLVYKPTVNTSFFASYANSFSVNTGQDVDGNNLPPSIIDQFETGVKNELLGGKLSANLTLYRIVNNNLSQTLPFLPDGTENTNTSIKVLTGQTISDGVELDLAAHPVIGLDITAGYSYNFARYTQTPNSAGSNVAGERLVNAPAHTANGTVFYTFQKYALKGLKLGASVFYTGERLAGWNNKVDQSQSFSRLIQVDGFTTIDLTAGYAYKKFSLLGKVSNLTNTLNYFVHENYSINPIPPTQFVATLSYKF